MADRNKGSQKYLLGKYIGTPCAMEPEEEWKEATWFGKQESLLIAGKAVLVAAEAWLQ